MVSSPAGRHEMFLLLVQRSHALFRCPVGARPPSSVDMTSWRTIQRHCAWTEGWGTVSKVRARSRHTDRARVLWSRTPTGFKPSTWPQLGGALPASFVSVCPGVRGHCSRKTTNSDPTPPHPNEDLREASQLPGHGLFKFKQLHENPWTVPNLLCVCRILSTPFLSHLIIQQNFDLSLALFALAGATDLLDGYIARTWPNQKSALGSALDPLADKILISVLYVSLTYAQLIPAALTALVIFRDVGLIAAVFWVRYKTVPPPVTLSKFFNPCYTTAQLKPTLFSKVNTVVQLLLVAASLAAPVFHFTDSLLLQSLWYITAVTTAASGYSYWHYGRKTVRVLNTKSP